MEAQDVTEILFSTIQLLSLKIIDLSSRLTN